MAVNYSTLFQKIGKLIKKGNSLGTLNGTTLPADLQEIVNAYGTTNTGTTTSQAPIEGINASYASLMEAVTSIRLTILAFADRTVTDYDTVVSQLKGLSSLGDLEAVKYLLIEDMVDQAQTVERSVVAVGAVSALARNVGNGTVLVDATLDGFNAPLAGGLVHPLYDGVLSELAPASVSFRFRCVGDGYETGDDGGETFEWGDGVDWGEASGFGEGAGKGPNLTAAGDATLLSNGDFESSSGSGSSFRFASWDVVSGTAGTHVRAGTSSPYRGASALRFVGDGSAEPEIEQDLGALTPQRRYCVTFRAKRVGGGSSTSYLNVYQTDGAGFSTLSGPASKRVATDALNADWTLYSFYWNVPLDRPADLLMRVGVSGGLPAGSEVWVDDLFFVPVEYHAGVNAVVVPGNVPFAVNDRLDVTVTSTEKVIQKFCRTHWKIQLPSAPGGTGSFGGLFPVYHLMSGSGAATLADTLAT